MSFLAPSQAPSPAEPKAELAPPPSLSPGRKAGAKSTRTTFLGSDAVPGAASGNFGGKTLLGE